MHLAASRFTGSGRARPRAGLVAIGLAALAAASCAAKVHKFHADPHDICPGTPVTLDWEVEGGRASVRGDPPLQPQSGRSYVPPASMRFILTVKRLFGDPIEKDTKVTVFQGTPSSPQPDEIAFTPTCAADKVVQEVDRPFTGWDPKITVATLEMNQSRDVIVEHEARQATLTAQDKKTSAFDGTKLGGTWKVSLPLLPGERCDGTGTTPPRVLILKAHVYCGM
jgi:hypothetical protein